MYYQIISRKNHRTTNLHDLRKKKVEQIILYDDIEIEDLSALADEARILGFPSITLRVKNDNWLEAKKIISAGITEIQLDLAPKTNFKRFVIWAKDILKHSKGHSPEFNIVLHIFIYATPLAYRQLLLACSIFKNLANVYIFYIGKEQDEKTTKLIESFAKNKSIGNLFLADADKKYPFSYTKICAKQHTLKFLQK